MQVCQVRQLILADLNLTKSLVWKVLCLHLQAAGSARYKTPSSSNTGTRRRILIRSDTAQIVPRQRLAVIVKHFQGEKFEYFSRKIPLSLVVVFCLLLLGLGPQLKPAR